MSYLVREVLDRMDPEIVLEALQGQLGTKTTESDIANEKIAKAFDRSGINCGPQATRSGFVQRVLLNYAGENMLRELHQKVAQKDSKSPS